MYEYGKHSLNSVYCNTAPISHAEADEALPAAVLPTVRHPSWPSQPPFTMLLFYSYYAFKLLW